jgi:hypothetical protein
MSETGMNYRLLMSNFKYIFFSAADSFYQGDINIASLDEDDSSPQSLKNPDLEHK